MNSLSVNNLSMSIDQNVLFEGVSFNLTGGQIIGFNAPTGKGKTSLLNFIAGIMDDSSCIVNGQILRDYSKVSYVFQELNLLKNESVLKNVMLPVEKIFGKKEAESKALNILRLVNIDNKCDSKVKNLSGGEKQRVAIARAFLYPGELLLLDEPFSSQDEQKKNHLIELTKEIVKSENRMCIVVSHNKEDFEKLGAQIIKL